MSEEATEEKKRGKVKFFNSNRYFGFIVREGDSKEIFFHGSGVLEKTPLEEGELVEFEVEEGKKGPNAVKVRRVEGKSDQLDLPLEEKESE